MLSLGLFFLRLAILILVVAAIFRIGQTTYNYCYGVVSDTAVDPEPGRDVSVTITKDLSGGQASECSSHPLHGRGKYRSWCVLGIYSGIFQGKMEYK